MLCLALATVTPSGKSVHYRVRPASQKEEHYKLESLEIEPHTHIVSLVTRAFIIVSGARPRNYSARGYGREPTPISDTREEADDLNISNTDGTRVISVESIRRRASGGRGGLTTKLLGQMHREREDGYFGFC